MSFLFHHRHIPIVFPTTQFHCLPPPLPPPLFHGLSSIKTTKFPLSSLFYHRHISIVFPTITFPLPFLHHHHHCYDHISIVFPAAPPPHFHCLYHYHHHISNVFPPPPPPHFHCLSSIAASTFPLSFLLHRHYISIFCHPPSPHFCCLSSTTIGDRDYHSSVIFPPPLPLHFYDFHTLIATTTTYCRTSTNITSAITLLLFSTYPHCPPLSILWCFFFPLLIKFYFSV